jgi:hypothetical protein
VGSWTAADGDARIGGGATFYLRMPSVSMTLR